MCIAGVDTLWMASDLKVDTQSPMPDFPTPPPTCEWKRMGGEVKDYGPDRTATGEKIKRPMNAFMVWAQMRRAEITAQSSKVHNSLISKTLGVEWREMSDDQKAPFVQRAKELRDELFREHPNYVYRPRKRKQRFQAYSPKPVHHTPTTTATTTAASTTTTPALSDSNDKSSPDPLLASQLPMFLYPSLLPNSSLLFNPFLHPLYSQLLSQIVSSKP